MKYEILLADRCSLQQKKQPMKPAGGVRMASAEIEKCRTYENERAVIVVELPQEVIAGVADEGEAENLTEVLEMMAVEVEALTAVVLEHPVHRLLGANFQETITMVDLRPPLIATYPVIEEADEIEDETGRRSTLFHQNNLRLNQYHAHAHLHQNAGHAAGRARQVQSAGPETEADHRHQNEATREEANDVEEEALVAILVAIPVAARPHHLKVLARLPLDDAEPEEPHPNLSAAPPPQNPGAQSQNPDHDPQ